MSGVRRDGDLSCHPLPAAVCGRHAVSDVLRVPRFQASLECQSLTGGLRTSI